MTSQAFGIAIYPLPDGVGSNRSPCIKVGVFNVLLCVPGKKMRGSLFDGIFGQGVENQERGCHQTGYINVFLMNPLSESGQLHKYFIERHIKKRN